MKAIVVQYQAKPECADENEQLIQAVFADLEQRQPEGFTYKVFRLEDGVRFVHVVVEHDVEDPDSLQDVPAFQAFVAGIADRCDVSAGRIGREGRRAGTADRTRSWRQSSLAGRQVRCRAMTNDTRTRILDVALDLFTEQGYDGTSLREIADRLGFTKAALYYHFQSKEQILVVLLEPADGMLGGIIQRLEDADGVEGWADALDWVIGQTFANLDVLRLVARNRGVVASVSEGLSILREHYRMHERIEQAVRAKASGIDEQIRMIAALGAVLGFDDWAPDVLAQTPPELLQTELRATVRDILRLPKARRARVAARAT